MTATSDMTRIVLRPMASLLPLGFFSFGIGVFLYSALELGWLAQAEVRSVALIGLVFVAPLELIAAVIGFIGRDSAGGTTMGIFSASWIALATLELTSPAGAHDPAVAVFAFAAAVVTALLGATAVGSKPFFTVLLGLASIRFALFGLSTLQLGKGFGVASGSVGLALVAASLYGGVALLAEDMLGRSTLPLFRRGAARRAIEGSMDEQLAKVAHEAGVRQQL